jgi:hypothetical protein
VQGLISGRPGKAEVSACGSQYEVLGAEDRGHDIRNGLEFQQHSPFGPMQLASRQARSAEGIAMGSPIAFPVLIQAEDFADHFIAPSLEDLRLLIIEDVSDDDKAVSTEKVDSMSDVGRSEDIEASDAVMGLKMRPQRLNLRIYSPIHDADPFLQSGRISANIPEGTVSLYSIKRQ